MSALGALLEREAELAELEAMLASARAGSGRLAVIEGRPGIGKTRLLDEAREAAEREGLEALFARGGELERDLPFGVVRQLFEASLRRASDGDRDAFLDGPAAPSAIVLLGADRSPDGAVADRGYTVLHGLYWLVSNWGERSPLLLAVDDLHWSDRPSLRFLHYLARRIGDLPVALLLSLRPAEPEAKGDEIGALRSDARATSLRPAALSEAGVARIVRGALGDAATAELCDACHAASGGNPFLVGELVTALRSDSVDVDASELPDIAGVVPDAVTHHVLVRLARLPASAARLARAVAVLGTNVDLRLAQQVAGLDEAAASEAADALARADLFRSEGPLEFAHPLIREAVYGDLPPGERMRAHADAARLLNEHDAQPERVAAQLRAAGPVRQPWAAGAFRAAADAALARGAPDSAVTFLDRALEEPLPDETRAALLFKLGVAAARSGDRRAAECFREAFESASEPGLRIRAGLALGESLAFADRGEQAAAVIERTVAEAGGRLPRLRDRVTGLVIQMAHQSIPTRRAVAPRIRELVAAAERLPEPPLPILAHLAAERAVVGGTADDVAALAKRALAGGRLVAELSADAPPVYLAAGSLTVADRLDEAERALTEAIVEARARGSTPGLMLASAFRARARYGRGKLAAAAADARTCVELTAEEGRVEIAVPNAAGTLLLALVDSGELDEAVAVAERFSPDRYNRSLLQLQVLHDGVAALRIAQGEPAEALESLELVADWERGWGAKSGLWVAWRSRAALAHLALGEGERALELATEEVSLARRFGAPRALGVALRVHGLAAGEAVGMRSLTQAVSVLEASAAELERARALADLGAARRRAGERKASREPLRRALELAHECGGVALEAWAHEELLATGARPRRRPVSGLEALTPTEQRVATMAAEGLSNREIAATLFVSLKTVEMHLSHTYRKLDLSSRSELPRALAGSG
ncbi:MAG: ATP-binding protein [Solirubrobacterales bacterium]